MCMHLAKLGTYLWNVRGQYPFPTPMGTFYTLTLVLMTPGKSGGWGLHDKRSNFHFLEVYCINSLAIWRKHELSCVVCTK